MIKHFAGEDGWPTTAKQGWSAAEFDTAANTHRFTPQELDLLLGLVDRTREQGLAVTDITREHFDHPDLCDKFAEWVQRFKHGQGLLVFSGFPVSERPVEDIWRLYWGVGMHFGIGVSQNTHGQLMGTVAVQEGVVGSRVYGTSTVAPLHSDRIDMLTLLCIRKAKSGGDNVFVNSLKVWDVVEQERPDLFALLKRGYPQIRNSEQHPGQAPVTPYRVPIFGTEQGLRSCYFGGNANLNSVERSFSEILLDADREALSFLAEVMVRPELQLHKSLEPGEAVFINNMEMLHSRTAFENGDAPSEKRLLLRMWLQGRPIRPIPQDMRVINNPSGNLGIEARPLAVAA
jgi:hypothetical protein